jgi:hypothetical protein
MARIYVSAIIGVLLALLIVGILNGTITGKAVADEEIIITFPDAIDFPNDQEATIVYEFGFPADSFKVNNKTADILLFLDSEIVSGLKIGYDAKAEHIFAGLPAMRSEPMTLLDGKGHTLEYTFHRAMGKQAIILDGVLIAEGKFGTEGAKAPITGLAVYKKTTVIESTRGINTRVE